MIWVNTIFLVWINKINTVLGIKYLHLGFVQGFITKVCTYLKYLKCNKRHKLLIYCLSSALADLLLLSVQKQNEK